MFYDRKTKYVDVYENGERIQNAGFIRIEYRENQIFFRLQILKLRSIDTYKCPITLISDKKEVQIGELNLKEGKGIWESGSMDAGDWKSNLKEAEWNEISIKLSGGRVLRCMIEENVGTKEIPAQKEEAALTDLQQEVPETEETKDCLEILAQSEDGAFFSEGLPMKRGEVPLTFTEKWQQLTAIYPHIRPFEDMREYLMLKPADLVVLPKKIFCLAGNSFLLHGYYNYEHLILAKEERGNQELFYIGVPGNFYPKEKQVAVLFGFESFEGKTEPAQNGDFGYYMISVDL